MTIEERLAELEKKLEEKDGISKRLDDIEKRLFFDEKSRDVYTATPTYIPTNSKDEVVLYKNGTTYRVYFYVSDAWKYVNLT